MGKDVSYKHIFLIMYGTWENVGIKSIYIQYLNMNATYLLHSEGRIEHLVAQFV
jgi:hypothetical protein